MRVDVLGGRRYEDVNHVSVKSDGTAVLRFSTHKKRVETPVDVKPEM